MSAPTLVERLLDEDGYYDGAANSIRHEAAARIEALEAIVEKLPKTADGRHVLPHFSRVYLGDREYVIESYEDWMYEKVIAMDESDGEIIYFATNYEHQDVHLVSCCFSTPDAERSMT